MDFLLFIGFGKLLLLLEHLDNIESQNCQSLNESI